jgi:hypothetical protein
MAIKKFQGNILVYPNPVKDELYIRFKTLSRCDYLIEIQDMTGRILMQQTCKQVAPDDIIRINSLPYAPGIYFLKINDSGNEAPFVISIRKVL